MQRIMVATKWLIKILITGGLFSAVEYHFEVDASYLINLSIILHQEVYNMNRYKEYYLITSSNILHTGKLFHYYSRKITHTYSVYRNKKGIKFFPCSISNSPSGRCKDNSWGFFQILTHKFWKNNVQEHTKNLY